MLESIDIKNYRNLKEIRINSFGTVNLITGKNNTGKSTLLEAIAVYATKCDMTLLYQLLEERGENLRQSEPNPNYTDLNIKTFSSLFTNRMVSYDISDSISIGSVENTLFGDEKSAEDTIHIRFIKYIDDIQKDDEGNTIRRRISFESELEIQLANYKIGLEIRYGKNVITLPLSEERLYRFGYKRLGETVNLQYIRTRNIDRDINGKLFDNITLTEKESYIIDALKIIEPNVERIAFVKDSTRERTAVIKLSNIPNVLPLRSMGDGINRILTIILALINSDNGYILIDEFENGLHYTVQEKLWLIIFNLAEKLNVQIFATTHSEDCISSFQNILNNHNTSIKGQLIRLDKKNERIFQVEFDAKELKIANENNIEVR